ncbi:LLM class flavin-dependent oxidoreductase [Pseudomaricurvus alkylphenolicus]|uniref:LLM class flavin-dependent oxidoreductase n=1 Tax=Pseudomaricurvus alkylphenolicus TaxID=1306991 RepID=UPI0014237185|nr:LLM class flavin-dependent oxidoreductase [Pseudomaricurvus alkylphenolicus]NIB38413.1 LLM class flavin-dependent oxidoreductase [Pseudomaricurvus alkylphenolicus]
MKVGVYQHGINWSWEKVKEYWLTVDKLGFDAGWMMDNGVYPDMDGNMLDVWETWTVLSILAEITDNIRMGPMVTPCRRRNPGLLAKMTACIDQISKGRLDLAIGSGDDPIYFVPWGQTYPKASERVKYLSEEIEILKRMWTEKAVNFEGEYYTLAEATADPKPHQNPHIPVWVGLVMGRKVMPKLAAEQADAINVYNASDRASAELLALVEEHCAEIGRDYHAIPKSRSVNVIMTDGTFNPSSLPTQADGSFPHVIGSPEELAQERAATLDMQHQRVKASDDKHSIYSRVTERHVIGTPDEIVDELKEIAGNTYEQVIIHGLNTMEDVQRFASDILPKLKD